MHKIISRIKVKENQRTKVPLQVELVPEQMENKACSRASQIKISAWRMIMMKILNCLCHRSKAKLSYLAKTTMEVQKKKLKTIGTIVGTVKVWSTRRLRIHQILMRNWTKIWIIKSVQFYLHITEISIKIREVVITHRKRLIRLFNQ